MGVTSITPFFGPVAQLVRAPACHAGGRRFEPDPGRQQNLLPQRKRPCRADAGSNASVCGRSSSGRAPPCQGGGSEFEPRRPLQNERKPRSIWWRGQVVRQRSAKPSFTSSNLVATSRTLVHCTGVFFSVAPGPVRCYNKSIARKEVCPCVRHPVLKTEPP